MTGKKDTERTALDRLADALVEDILDASDEDILTEFTEDGGDAKEHGDAMRKSFENRLLAANKARMAAAKAGVAAARRAQSEGLTAQIDLTAARVWLSRLGERPDVPEGLTLAARKEDELSDADIRGMLEDLAELGLKPPGYGGSS
ncbi:MAG: hypothetical protein AAFR79_00760 [Pseudomonadota bacterium]